MDGNAPQRRPARGWILGLVLLALVAAVAIASTGSVPGGKAGVRRPADQLLDVTMSLLVVVILAGGVVAILVFALFRRDDAVVSMAGGKRRRGPAQAIASAAMGLVLVLVALRFLKSDDGREAGDGVIPGLDQVPGLADEQQGRYEPEFTIWPVVVTLALALAAGTAIVLERRARRRAAGPPPLAAPEEALADVLDETLDDLRAETDPRRAVIAAYARMERALRAAGLPRHESEAPEEYLTRVVDGVELSRRAASRLTALFAWARFSGHDVRPEMKDEAIDTLEAVRDELRATAARREALAAARLAEAAA
jgi:Domain of unknown function (DUF4129)